MKYIILIPFLLPLWSIGQSTEAPEPMAMLPIGSVIELINKLIPTKEPDTSPIKKIEANKKKGWLVRRYNRWLRRKRITPVQYDILMAELLQVDIQTLNNYQRVVE